MNTAAEGATVLPLRWAIEGVANAAAAWLRMPATRRFRKTARGWKHDQQR